MPPRQERHLVLDNLPPAVRHALFALLAALLFWLQDALPSIAGLPDVVKAVAATVVTLALAYITPLTRQYGVGAPADAVDVGDRHESSDGDGVGI